jgi:hypothetical protein
MHDDSGQVTAFVVIIAATLVLFAGLVVDGGLTLTAQVRAMDEAQAAARAGADAVNVTAYRTHDTVSLSPTTAMTAAESYLAATGDSGTVSISGDRVTVTVLAVQRMQIFSLVGLSAKTVTATATATPDEGVTGINQ